MSFNLLTLERVLFIQVLVHQQPLIAPLPLRQFVEQIMFPPSIASSTQGVQATSRPIEMYSSNWIVFQPDKIIDAMRGCMHKVMLNLKSFPYMISDRCVCGAIDRKILCSNLQVNGNV